MPHTTHLSPEMKACIDACLSCYSTCTETAQHCLRMGGSHAEHSHMATLLACAEICRTSAHTMLLGSNQHVHTCRACAEICKACEADCRSMRSNDEMMQRCAEECRRCAESCAKMSQAG